MALAADKPVAFADVVPAEVRKLAGGLDLRNAMVAVLRGKEKPIGTILIANRIGLARGFMADDLALFETLAANASAALQFDRLEQAVSELRELQRQLHHQAYHDPLTGLANRALFTRRIDAALQQGGGVAVMFIDLDDFKGVNDTLGHAVGDQLLCAAAKRISGCVRDQELVARLGGDEFAVLVCTAHETVEEVAASIARRIVGSFELPVEVGERLLSIQLTIGVATNLHSGRLTADLLRDADVAMYEAKSAGKGRFCTFTTEMRESVLRHHVVREELRDSIEEERLLVQYQPIIDIQSGHLSAVEALVRWEHPERGRIPPLEFIPLAERTGLIVPLGRYVLRKACTQAAEWSRDSGRPISVQVNVSARELESPDLIHAVREVLDETGLDPNRLILEITESVMIQDAAAGGMTLAALRDVGVQLALDDFGTGYSSLSYMRSLPLSALKIAKEFVDGLAHSEEDKAFVRLIVELARTRGLRVIAEGIEDAEQLSILRALECDSGQGYYFAKPLDAGDPELRAAVGLGPSRRPEPVRG
jgi:diguanylate cyclase (GGDEF)-like protein